MKNESIHIRVTEELKCVLVKNANDLGISLSSYVVAILKENIKIKRSALNE